MAKSDKSEAEAPTQMTGTFTVTEVQQPAVEPQPPSEPDAQLEPPAPVAEKPKTVTVHCAIANGMTLSFMGAPASHTEVEGLTIPTDVHKNFTIKLGHGPNHGIDADAWDRWVRENENYSAYVSGHIFATPDYQPEN